MNRARQRDPVWKLALNFSVNCAVAGAVLALIGAWIVAASVFALGLALAGVAALLLHRRTSQPAASDPAARTPVTNHGRRARREPVARGRA